MKFLIDTDSNILTRTAPDGTVTTMPLISREGYEELSAQWMRVGWAMGAWYSYTWYGRPILAHPEDLVRMQEVIFQMQPDYVIETGVAHGGSLVFYASLFEAMGKGRVIGMDIKILPEDREAILAHPLAKRIEIIEGSSTDPSIVKDVKQRIPQGAKVLVVLDSDHTKAHVAAELAAYHDFVTLGSYIVACDGIISLMNDVPGVGNREWIHDNATEAAKEFVRDNPNFIIETPPWPFNRSQGLQNAVTYWPGAWLKRVH